MFKVESYVSPILLSYVDKYVRDFKPADAQLSLWGGGVTLHNLVLKADVLQQEMALPFTLVSGRIHELLIQVPWTKIMSEPIVVTINTIECVLSLNPRNEFEENPSYEQVRNEVVEAPPGYMQALVRRIVSNISVRVNSLIVKYVHDDVVLSLNVKRLFIDSVGPDWKPAFTDIDPCDPVVRRLVRLDDLTLCLDRSDSDGKIRHYQEPLLYRCLLEIRLLTTLMSVNSRKAKNLSIQLRSSNLEWGVTSEQLVLLLRLLRERPTPAPSPLDNQFPTNNSHSAGSSSTSLDQAHVETWTDWAWSWMPSWTYQEDIEETPSPARQFPILFSAFLDKLSFVFKVMETEPGSSRKRARPLLELSATYGAVTYLVCAPTTLRVRAGARTLLLVSHGKCTCGHTDLNALHGNPTVFLTTNYNLEDEFEWPEDVVAVNNLEVTTITDEDNTFPQFINADDEIDTGDDGLVDRHGNSPEFNRKEDMESMWFQMMPVVFVQYEHDRDPIVSTIDPYDNPPRDFEHSDWREKVLINVSVRPILLNVGTGLLHRLEPIRELLNNLPPVVEPELIVRPLTFEECEALTDNLPERKAFIRFKGLQLHLTPWDHSLTEAPAAPLATLEIAIGKIDFKTLGPLYPDRVCAAACQMELEKNIIRDQSHLRFCIAIMDVVGRLSTPTHRLNRPIFKGAIIFSGHYLLHRELFKEPELIFFGDSVVFPAETSVYMTSPAMQTAAEVLRSLYYGRHSMLLRETTVAEDAMQEKDLIAIDGYIAELYIYPRFCHKTKCVTITVQSIKVTGVELKNGQEKNVAWVFSAPDYEINQQPWMTLKIQMCEEPSMPGAVDYVSVEIETCAFSLDPMLFRWLTYRPRMRPDAPSTFKQDSVKSASTSKYFIRRRTTPPSSSGRGSRAGSAAEFVHTRTRSADSGSERSDRRGPPLALLASQMKPPEKLWDNEKMLNLYNRLRRTLIRADIAAMLVYTAASSSSAQHCPTMHDAMERQAREKQNVFVVSLGHWVMTSSAHDVWEYINIDQPTILPGTMKVEDSFPWKFLITDLSSYTLETCVPTMMTAKDREMVRIHAQAPSQMCSVPRIVLNVLSSSMTISVVKKTAGSRPQPKRPDAKRPPPSQDDQKQKYFTGGVNFTPMTLRDYVRGPRSRPGTPEGLASPEARAAPPEPAPDGQSRGDGPLVSLGVCIHGDTPPVTINLMHDQVRIIRAAVHCLTHICALLKKPRTPIPAPKNRSDSVSLTRSNTGLEQRSSSEETPTENPSEQLIPIFQSRKPDDHLKQLKTFIWLQWVVSHASVAFYTKKMKISVDLEDLITTIDLQETYEQFRLKIVSGTIYHFKPLNAEATDPAAGWEPGVLGGRVLETREPADGKNLNFFTTTVTRARFANLPANWREDHNIKPFRQTLAQRKECMWELFVSMAPLEVILHPALLEAFTLIGEALTLRSFCPVQLDRGVNPLPMPFCHVDLSGMRLIINSGEASGRIDDTLIISVGNIKTIPYPDNPICRRSVNTAGEASWIPAASGSDGRQHELIIKGVSVRSARIRELLSQILEARTRNERNVNPAANWAEPLPIVTITPMLHNVDVNGVVAPPIYCNGGLACGPALELSVPSDVAVELSVPQVGMLTRVLPAMQSAVCDLRYRRDETPTILNIKSWCPFSKLIVFDEEPEEEEGLFDEAVGGVSDSGMESQPSTSFMEPQPPRLKKSASGVTNEILVGPLDHVEVFMVMGRIDAALYVRDDRSARVRALRLPARKPSKESAPEPNIKIVINPIQPDTTRKDDNDSTVGSRSLTETVREADVGRSRLDIVEDVLYARRAPSFIPLVHATLFQPNLYYWKKKSFKKLQFSLFNAWVALGEGQDRSLWHEPLLSTRDGTPDPDTEIPPSLACVRFETVPSILAIDQNRDYWSVNVDIDRPVIVDVNDDNIQRLKNINKLIERAINGDKKIKYVSKIPPLRRLRGTLTGNSIESITLNTVQLLARTWVLRLGCEAVRAQAANARRPERMSARALLDALTLTVGPEESTERRPVLLHPVMIGIQAEAAWEPWRAGEPGMSPYEPSVRILLDVNEFVVDIRPNDIIHLMQFVQKIVDKDVRDVDDSDQSPSSSPVQSPSPSSIQEESVEPDSIDNDKDVENPESGVLANSAFRRRNMMLAFIEDISMGSDAYYKDDLRSGAFKIMSGSEARMPMAYEVSVRESTVVWHYPMPRSIARVVAYPLPDCDEEVDCVLECFNHLLNRWESNAYFQIPVSESGEYRLTRSHSDKVFAFIWRVRLVTQEEENLDMFEFKRNKYIPQDDPVVRFASPAEEWSQAGRVSGEQLAGALRIDSYLATRLTPRLHLAVRCAALALNVHNGTPPSEPPDYPIYNDIKGFEGIYVTKSQRKSHRALSLMVQNGLFNITRSSAHRMMSYECLFGVDMFESETGTMERLVDDFRLQGVFADASQFRARVRAGDVRVTLNVPRVHTLRVLAEDWSQNIKTYITKPQHIEYDQSFFVKCMMEPRSPALLKLCLSEQQEMPSTSWNLERIKLEEACKGLEGRVYLFVTNKCDLPLRVGQEGTDETILLEAGTTLAYRWKSPLAPKNLQIARAGHFPNWHWTTAVPFEVGTNRVRLDRDKEAAAGGAPGPHYGTFVHTHVEDFGGRKHMSLCGKVLLVNMLRHNLCYKVRVRDPKLEASLDGMRVVAAGELPAESVGRTVLVPDSIDTYIKIKFASQPNGWTGDIPLKECPKQHVPWLVKVPSTGDVPCVSVWCRVERTRSDNRVTVLFSPMFVMRSHLPLDVDVTMTTDPIDADEEEEASMPTLTQKAAGRGYITHLLAHGTTTVRHTLNFKYRSIDCQVTREPVPMHYGMTERSVFEQHSPPTNAEDMASNALEWLKKGCRAGENDWPYSPVRRHWPSLWQAATLQPRTDIVVRYLPVECCGGGCGLAAHLIPRALFVNATPLTPTLRSSDAAPLCALEPGTVIAPPFVIVEEPFYVSIEEERQQFLSKVMRVSPLEPGVYGTLPAGHLAIDRTTDFAIHCPQRVALLTLHFSMHMEINVFGLTSTYIFMNKLPESIFICPLVVTYSPGDPPILQPKNFTLVKPCLDGYMNATRLTHFWLNDRHVSDELDALRMFLCLSLAADGGRPVSAFVPIAVGRNVTRRSLALRDQYGDSVPVVITQVKHEGRWVVTVAADDHPQYVVRNHTRQPLALAQPLHNDRYAYHGDVTAVVEAVGCKWCFVLPPGDWSYYSTVDHMAHRPTNSEPNNDLIPPRDPFLVVGRLLDEFEPEWSYPIPVRDGDQMVQMLRSTNFKLRMRVYPNCTNVDLYDIDEDDLSASEIRSRLARNNADEHDELSPLLQTFFSDNRLVDELETNLEDVEEDTRMIFPPIPLPELHKVENVGILPKSEEQAPEATSTVTVSQMDFDSETSFAQVDMEATNLDDSLPPYTDWLRAVAGSVSVQVAHSSTAAPLVRLVAERVGFLMQSNDKTLHTTLSIGDVQVDNLQHESQMYDFPVVASTSDVPRPDESFPPLWGMLLADRHFDTRIQESNVVFRTTRTRYHVIGGNYESLHDVDVYVGPLSLYMEDAFVRSASELTRLLVPPPRVDAERIATAEAQALYRPLCLNHIHVHPLDLTLTLHTSLRVYIALDKSPLRLSAFRLDNVITTPDRLTHELTVHYLSGAIFGAGWVVGGLELLGAPGSLAARVASARGGVRGVASTAAAALLRSLNSCAGSLARNLDLLVGDDEHTRRAAAARRVAPQTFVGGLLTGVQNFAVNLLGAVGGLAHHPLVGVAVGESSGAVALRRGLVGALVKPISATADLVAFAGQGLLSQTGWDPDPEQRAVPTPPEPEPWRRDCARWALRLTSLTTLIGVDVISDDAQVRIIITDKFLVMAEPTTERIAEMIDFRFCKLVYFDGQTLELRVTKRHSHNDSHGSDGEDLTHNASLAAMERVAKYTGARSSGTGRVLVLQTPPRRAPALAAAIAVARRQSQPTHIMML
ncbi:intermembrane lipid transfer protein VPS13B isoform X3 [Epargyreus clarus]|uniref:intermembrane lipid transfer protein VPS13B isoform X3 n=1 Tax=Epargyreus clarus TaxID=520877 RepID=UPI003C2ACFD6